MALWSGGESDFKLVSAASFYKVSALLDSSKIFPSAIVSSTTEATSAAWFSPARFQWVDKTTDSA